MESCARCLVLVIDVQAELVKLMNIGASVRVRDQSDGTLLRSTDGLPSLSPVPCGGSGRTSSILACEMLKSMSKSANDELDGRDRVFQCALPASLLSLSITA